MPLEDHTHLAKQVKSQLTRRPGSTSGGIRHPPPCWQQSSGLGRHPHGPPAPYHPAPRSHWGRYLGSGTSPAGGPNERQFLAVHLRSLSFWQPPSSTSGSPPAKPGPGEGRGRHREGQCLLRAHPSPAHLEPEGEEQRPWAGREGGRVCSGTDRDDPGAVGDEVSRRDVPGLVFVAPHVQGELHRALRAELLTRAVLRQEEKLE